MLLALLSSRSEEALVQAFAFALLHHCCCGVYYAGVGVGCWVLEEFCDKRQCIPDSMFRFRCRCRWLVMPKQQICSDLSVWFVFDGMSPIFWMWEWYVVIASKINRNIHKIISYLIVARLQISLQRKAGSTMHTILNIILYTLNTSYSVLSIHISDNSVPPSWIVLLQCAPRKIIWMNPYGADTNPYLYH